VPYVMGDRGDIVTILWAEHDPLQTPLEYVSPEQPDRVSSFDGSVTRPEPSPPFGNRTTT